jgi:hypothetical protein
MHNRLKILLVNPQVPSTVKFVGSELLLALSAAALVSVFPLRACVGATSNSDGSISSRLDRPAADGNNCAQHADGPTILLGYGKDDFKKNPVSSFMYFVPLISPTPVRRHTSAGGAQQIGVIAYRMKTTSKNFEVICELEISGTGVHTTAFDPADMIMANIKEVKKGRPLTNMLDYLRFENGGFARIEVSGAIAGSKMTVSEVRIQLDARGHNSPVTIGLYDIIPKDGQYRYENRSNEMVARVNTLVFRNGSKTPRMGIKVASLAGRSKPDDIFKGVKGAIANLLMDPPEVTPLGNDTVLAFGRSLLNKEPAFTFPCADNIKESRVVEMDYMQKFTPSTILIGH